MKQHTTQQFIEKAKAVHGEKYDYSKVEYLQSHTKVCIICPEHGEFWQMPTNHFKGNGCFKCSRLKAAASRSHTTEQFIERAKAVHGTKYDYSKVDYIGAKIKVCIICHEHGKFYQTPFKHVSTKQGCPECGKKSSIKTRTKTLETFIEQAQAVHGTKYDYSKVEYVYNHKTVCVVCPKHGEFWITPGNHTHIIKRQGCPKCSKALIRSKPEKELVAFLRQLKLKVETSNRSILKPRELDLVIPDRKLAIEFNGIYWHTTKFVDKNYHLDKLEDCLNKGYQLVQIAEKEWRDSKVVIKSIISAKLGFFKRKISATKTKVSFVSEDAAESFQKKNHIEKNCYGSIRLGLFCKNELVALMLFSKPKTETCYDWELLCFCTKLDTQVVGGASKLLKYFQKNYVGSIITYVNRNYDSGDLYRSLGFKYMGKTDPNYVWVKGNKHYTQDQVHNTTLIKLLGKDFNPKQSVIENMENNGYYKSYDCGNLIFIK